jgi:hypothetical protein
VFWGVITRQACMWLAGGLVLGTLREWARPPPPFGCHYGLWTERAALEKNHNKQCSITIIFMASVKLVSRWVSSQNLRTVC